MCITLNDFQKLMLRWIKNIQTHIYTLHIDTSPHTKYSVYKYLPEWKIVLQMQLDFFPISMRPCDCEERNIYILFLCVVSNFHRPQILKCAKCTVLHLFSLDLISCLNPMGLAARMQLVSDNPFLVFSLQTQLKSQFSVYSHLCVLISKVIFWKLSFSASLKLQPI